MKKIQRGVKALAPHYVLATSVLSVVVGLLVLVGWTFDITALKSVLPTWVSMKANTAICFILIGLTLVQLRNVGPDRPLSKRQLATTAVGPLVVFAIGLLTLLEHLRGTDFGIDCLFFDDPTAGGAPGRMAGLSAVNFLFIGGALLALRRRPAVGLAHVLSAIVGLLTFLPLIGLNFGTAQLGHGIVSFAQMAIHTTILFLMLSVAMLAVRAQEGAIGLATSSSLGGLLLRRQLPAVISILLVLTWLRYEAEKAGYFSMEFGISFMTFSSILLVAIVAVFSATLVNKIEAERREAADNLLRLNGELERRVRARTEEVERARIHAQNQAVMLETVLEQMPMAVVVAEDSAGKLILSNSQVAEVWRHPLIPSENIEGYGEWVGYHPDGRRYRGHDWPLARAITSGEIVKNEVTEVLRGDGTRATFRLSAAPVRNSDAKIIAGIVVCEDVTESIRTRRELEQAQLRIQTILGNAPIAIWSLDAQACFTYCEGRTLSRAGLKPNELIGQSALERYEKIPWLREAIRKAFRGDSLTCEGQIGERHFEILLTPQRNGGSGIDGVIGLTLDVTDRKRAELDRSQLAVQEQMARESSRLKSEFLANMSHEIRTPLNGVLGLTDLLLETKLDNQQRDFAETIKTSGETLLTLVNDILDLSKVESGKIQLELVDFDLANLVRSVYKSFEHAAQRKSLAFTMDVTTLGANRHFKGDPGRLRQVLVNLVGNAIKFTESGTVAIRLEVVPESRSSRVKFHVHDTGIGIPPEALARLFRAFAQADSSTTRRFGGTGLGLSISKQLVELMNGRITATSEAGKGSVFSFEVSLEEGLAPARADKVDKLRRLDEGGANYRVLVAEDNVTNQKLILAMLKILGCRANAVADGQEVLTALSTIPYDLILMDCQMPEMDGYEATRQIRAARQLPHAEIPIIALTANAIAGDRERCLEAGMNDYLSKPISSEKLHAALAKWLPRRSRNAVDLNRIEEILGLDPTGGVGILQEICEVYFREGRELVAAVQASANAEALARAAHSLKSASANVGARTVASLCYELERLGQAGALIESRPLVRSLADDFDSAVAALRLIIDERKMKKAA